MPTNTGNCENLSQKYENNKGSITNKNFEIDGVKPY